MAKGDMLKALMKSAGKDKVTKMLQKMTEGGTMPTDVLELKQMPGGGPVMGSMINPELSKAEMGKEYEYGYGGMVSKKKKKSKKKK